MGRVVDDQGLVALVAADRAAGRTIAFANGCFDVLHVGHVRYLEGARREGDRLIVAVNDDDSVRQLKGSGRPILPATARAELVAALRAADYVVVFADRTVERLLRLVRPDVHCKGTDYTLESVPEADVMRSIGGRIAIVGDHKDHSTRALLAKLGAQGPGASKPPGFPAFQPSSLQASTPHSLQASSPEPFLVWLLAHRRVPLGFVAGIFAYWLAAPTVASIALGCLVAAPGEALRIWAAGHLQKAREVTTSGPYRLMRHPLYIGSSVMGLGFAIASGTLWSSLVVVAYLVLTMPTTARREEASLDRELDGAYASYREGRTVPSDRRFQWSQVQANREVRALAGFALAIALLVLRARI
jgi:rfaE bifunctional protein nucleotidyltransferase chain/domain